MRFQDLPRFISGGNYAVDISWDYLEHWLGRHHEDGFKVDLDPDFQRGHVWDDKKRAAYVEYVIKGGQSSKSIWWNCRGWNTGSSKWPLVLVDGKQRLEAVRKFLRDELAIFKMFNGKRGGYKRSDFEDKVDIIDCRFRMHVNNLETRAEVLTWYLDLNEGGVVHTEKELARVRQLLNEERKG